MITYELEPANQGAGAIRLRLLHAPLRRQYGFCGTRHERVAPDPRLRIMVCRAVLRLCGQHLWCSDGDQLQVRSDDGRTPCPPASVACARPRQQLVLRRLERHADCTIGQLLLDGEPLVWTLEPVDRGLRSDSTAREIALAKQCGPTAIPTGAYVLSYTWSPRFGRRLPLVQGVAGYSGIRIHAGNSAADTRGCILPGLHHDGSRVTGSREALRQLLGQLRLPATLTLTRAYA